jgi:formylmethanofuran--tetrahydromethanopterin N-formyltransferase
LLQPPGKTLEINSTVIDDMFAEAFPMKFTRLVITAIDQDWLNIAAQEFCGYGTSVIGCDAEVGVESRVPAEETPDGRAGISVLLFAFSRESLEQAVVNRVGQCLLPCPTTAVFDGLPDAAQKISLGRQLRFFGDGFQKSKLLGDRRFWRVPVMDGEFIVEEAAGSQTGVAGGNFLIESCDQRSGLAAARRAIAAISEIKGVITPFPGGVVRSGSKVGSRYKSLRASTSEAYCPTLRGQVESRIHASANCVYEIVIDGVDFETVASATTAGVRAAIGKGSSQGVVAISAGNYGGQLGQHHFHLHELLNR